MGHSSVPMGSSSSECLWPDQPSRCDTILGLQYTFATISLACLLFVIASILLFKLYKLFVQRLILFMCLSAAVKSCLNFISVDQIRESNCIAQAFFSQFFAWSELLWVCAITMNIVMVVHGYQPERYEKRMHLFVWLISLFWGLVPLFGKYYGPAGSWCWIQREYTAVRFGVWYVPFMLILALMICAYVYLLCFGMTSGFHEMDGTEFEMEQIRSQRRKEVMPLLFYPIIYLILNLPLLIYRVEDAVYPDERPIYTLLVLSVIASPLTGAFNALAFAILEDTLRESCTVASIKAALSAWCFGDSARVTHNYEVIDENNESGNEVVA